jgi:hypothetical protein
VIRGYTGLAFVKISDLLWRLSLWIHNKAGKILLMSEENIQGLPPDNEISWVTMRTERNGVNLFTMYAIVAVPGSPEYIQQMAILPGEIVWAYTIEEMRIQAVINYETRKQQLSLLKKQGEKLQ